MWLNGVRQCPSARGGEISVKRIITKIAADFKRDAEEILTGCRKDIRAARISLSRGSEK